jgi:hypothetical protein
VYHGAPPGNWGHGGWSGPRYYPHSRVFIAPPFPSVFIGSGFGYGYYPYYYPYAYPYPYYGYPSSYPYPPPGWSPDQQYPPDQGQPPATPPPPDTGSYQPPDQSEGDAAPPSPDTSSYGMVQLRSVPDGAAIDLDGRYWFDARQLDDRWLPVPPGLHTITVRQPDHAPLARRVDVSPGRSQVISLESFSDDAG